MRDDRTGSQPKDDRKARLAEQLRANLQKRKAQARSRRTGEADSRQEGIAAAADCTDVPNNSPNGIRGLGALCLL